MRSKILRLFSALLTAALALLLAANVYVIAVRAVTGEEQPTVLGFTAAVVVTGSMSPAIEPGDLVVCRRAADYGEDDVIMFRSGASLVTHRIVGDTPDGFTTRGDANNVADIEPVQHGAIVGKVVFTVPRIGLFIEKLRTPLGMTVLVLIGFALIELSRVFDKSGENKEVYHGKHSE